MSDVASPFAAQPGVTMSNATADTPPPAADQGGASDGKAGQGHVAPGRPQQPQRARLGDFGRSVVPRQEQRVVDMPEDASDAWSGLVERSTKQADLAKYDPKPREGIEYEAQVIREQGERDQAIEALADAGEHDDQPLEVEATLLWDDPRLQEDPRYQEWKAAHEWRTQLDQADELPPELMKKFVRIQGKDGRTFKVTADELSGSFWRQSDYTNKLREVYALRDELDARERGLGKVTHALTSKNVPAFMDMIAYIGGLETFQAAAIQYGLELAAEGKMSPEEKQVRAYARQRDLENYQLKVQLQSMQAQQQAAQQQQPAPDVNYYNHQLSQMIPLAIQRLAAAGTPYVDSTLAQDLFARDWEVFARGSDELSTEAVMNVMRGVMEQVGRYEQAGVIQAPEPAAARQLPPVARTAPPPAAPSANRARPTTNGTPQRARLGDIAQIARPSVYR